MVLYTVLEQKTADSPGIQYTLICGDQQFPLRQNLTTKRDEAGCPVPATDGIALLFEMSKYLWPQDRIVSPTTVLDVRTRGDINRMVDKLKNRLEEVGHTDI